MPMPMRSMASSSVIVDGAATADEVAAFLELARTGVEIKRQAPTPSSLTHCLISTQARTLPVAPAEMMSGTTKKASRMSEW